MQGQGFLARFLIAWPPSLAGTRLYQEVDPYQDAKLKSYRERMSALLIKAPPIDEHGELKPAKLMLDQQAKDAWIAEYNAIEAELALGGEMFDIKPTAAKAAENLLRIAGVLAWVGNSKTISKDHIERAARLMRWYLNEALRLTSPIKVDLLLAKAQKLLEWLISKEWKHFERRVLQKDGPPLARKSAKKRDELLAVLVEYRHLLTCDGKTFRLNPRSAATYATTASAPVLDSTEVCDTSAAGCDRSRSNDGLSQPVATLSQPQSPASSRGIAPVADVATPLPGEMSEDGTAEYF
ncbi:hypothetical protein D3C78_1012080 [compost metagenome]